MPGYTLHNRRGSGGFAVEMTLRLGGVEHELSEITSNPGERLTGRIDHLNPWGQLPVLDLPDGARMTEVAAMLIHLSEAHQGCRAGPHLWVDDRPGLLRACVYLAVNVYEYILRRSYPERHFDPSHLPADTDPASATRAIQSAADTRAHQALMTLEAMTPGPFLLGQRLSPADLFLAQLYAWHTPRPDLPKCTAITHHVAMHPLINPHWSRHFHDRLDIKWHEGRTGP